MPENSSVVPLVRCPKCGEILPELPPYSVYCCGGCGAFLQAEKRSSVDDGLSEKSWEERTDEGSEREGNGEIVGIDRDRRNERSATTNRVSKSPVRSRYGDAIRKSPIRESNMGDVDVHSKSPTKRSMLGDFDVRSKSFGRSMDGDVGKSSLRESSLGGLDGLGRSPARSVPGGVRKSPMRESVLGDFDEQRSVERDVADPEEMEAREKVGAWFDHVKEEVGYGNRLVTQKGSFNEWLHYEASADESELHRSRVSPRRRTWSLDESPIGFGLNSREEQVGRRADQSVDETESGYGSLYGRRRVEVPHDDDWVRRGDHGLPRGRRNLRGEDGYVGDFGGVHVNNKAASVRQRFPAYPSERHSDYLPYYGYDQPRHSRESSRGSSSLQNVEMNRAELFHMYNVLKEELSRTGDLPENPDRREHHRVSSADCYGGPDDHVHGELLRSRRQVASVDIEERMRMRRHYMDSNQVLDPLVNDHNVNDISSFPRSRFGPNEFPLDDDPFWPQIPRRNPYHPPHYYPQRSSHDYMPRHYVDSSYDPSGLNPQRDDLHHPSCTCSHCHPNNLRTHMQAPPAFGYRRNLNCQTDPVSDFPDPYVQSASGSGFPHSTPHQLSTHSRSSVDSKSDGGGSAQDHSKRTVVGNQNKLLCIPIAGAAPFVTCYNCCQLLRLPRKLIAMKKCQVRLQCGSCLTTLSFDFKKKAHASMLLQPRSNATNAYDVPSEVSESDHKTTHDGSSAGITKPESYDFDATGYTFPSTDSEPSMQLDRRLNSSEAEKMQGLCPSSSIASKDDLDLDNAVNKTDSSSSVMKMLRPPPGSPLHEHMDYSDVFAAKKPDEKETEVSGHDKGITEKDGSSLNYGKNADAPTELEINSDEIPKGDLSQRSAEASSRSDKGGNKKGEPAIAGILGRRFQDSSPSINTSNAKADVFVNGQPLAHRAVRKAEKLAGPVSPGKYWYDSRAGFWGVMGGCCVGIIPPFIQEFGFPMPVDCAGGNTGIYVNGRELHEKDLDLLASRGFPRTRKKLYVVDISGKVQDEDTGDVVVDLGKLAPSVEKAKRGFGMHSLEA